MINSTKTFCHPARIEAFCHPERSEGSHLKIIGRVLEYAQPYKRLVNLTNQRYNNFN
jgi:hypothetical protein